MNRTRSLSAKLYGGSSTAQIIQELPAPPNQAQGSCHATFVPVHYEPNYAYPLLVWLHGDGENEGQLRRVIPEISVRNYVAVAPRGTWAERDRDDGAPPQCCTWPEKVEDISVSEHRILECIEQTRQRFHIGDERIFLAGCDCGGTMALRLAMMHPEWFAGVVSIGGHFPQGYTPLVRLKQARRVQLLIQQGRTSSLFSESQLCDDLRLLHAAGMSISVRQYPVGDQVTPQMLGDLNTWVMQQVTGAGVASDEMSDYSSPGRN